MPNAQDALTTGGYDPTKTSALAGQKPGAVGAGAGGANPYDPTQGGGSAPDGTSAQATSLPPTPPSPPNPPQGGGDGTAPPASAGPDPFAASGGGTYFASTGQWVPNSNTSALQQAQAANGGVAGVGGAGGASATNPTSLPPAAPGSGPPLAPTQSDQDLYTKALVSQMTQDQVPTVNDPAIQAQIDPLRVENERMMDAEVRNGAEQAFAGGQSFGNPERVAAAERAGERQGVAASQAVQTELQARRAQISDALSKYGAWLSDEQKQDLAAKQQEIDKQLALSAQDIQRQGLGNQLALGQGDIAARLQLGTGQNANQLLGILLNNNQANNSLAAQLGISQAQLNQGALASLMNG